MHPRKETCLKGRCQLWGASNCGEILHAFYMKFLSILHYSEATVLRSNIVSTMVQKLYLLFINFEKIKNKILYSLSAFKIIFGTFFIISFRKFSKILSHFAGHDINLYISTKFVSIYRKLFKCIFLSILVNLLNLLNLIYYIFNESL